ncbi:hypothetical protein G210_5536 [Candida maltosa Xu316]|uniref:Uncharacterized protein n=1 Tax=Candida maltosa (strain Xu316) TaxID=1245528 RepID=M3JBZ3_CANMX|nr:hypothetical protein G210_5536 [Candida maltosa Xu316]
MGSSASKQSGRKLAKVVSENTTKSINRTTNVKQLPSQTLKEKFEQSQQQPEEVRSDASTNFDPKFLQKKLKGDESIIPEGKDGGDPHEQGTSTYDKSFLSSVSKLGSQIQSVELNLARDKNALALQQLRSRKKLYDIGEQQLKGDMEHAVDQDAAAKTLVHPQTLSAILRDLKDDRVKDETIIEDYQLHPGFLKKLGTRIRLPTTTVIIEDDVKPDEVGHKKVPPQRRRDISEVEDEDPVLEDQQYNKLKKRIISILSKYTPCDVSDSLNKHGIANGGFIPNLTNQSPVLHKPSAVGKAYTVLYAAKNDPRPAVKEAYIDQVPEDAFVVIGLPLELQTVNAPYITVNNALYGGLMSTRAQYRKANGSVILGRIRDLDEHRDLEYPVWSYGVGTSAPGPLVKVVGINVPLEVKVASIDKPEEILTINPGDYIIGDKNGIVKLDDNESLNSVLDYIPKRVDADTRVSQDIKEGKPAAESQKFWRSKI